MVSEREIERWKSITACDSWKHNFDSGGCQYRSIKHNEGEEGVSLIIRLTTPHYTSDTLVTAMQWWVQLVTVGNITLTVVVGASPCMLSTLSNRRTRNVNDIDKIMLIFSHQCLEPTVHFIFVGSKKSFPRQISDRLRRLLLPPWVVSCALLGMYHHLVALVVRCNYFNNHYLMGDIAFDWNLTRYILGPKSRQSATVAETLTHMTKLEIWTWTERILMFNF